MLLKPVPLATTVKQLKQDHIDLIEYIHEICDHIDSAEPTIQALLSEPNRRGRLIHEAEQLIATYPNPNERPPLFGILVGVKDIFHADGFTTRAGTTVPSDVLQGNKASTVTALKQNGALILGKTVTTEFAYYEPGPTRNPHNPDHTPGGSSSGSAAAVAAGFCHLALGTQTVGSVIRPAAFCGIIGYKPSHNRINHDGLIMFSETFDHVGLFTQDIAGMQIAASVLCHDWREADLDASALPILAVPDGAYLQKADPTALNAFEQQLSKLEKAGYAIKRMPLLDDIDTIDELHRDVISAELAEVHQEWFAQYEAHYRSRTRELIQRGQSVSSESITKGQDSQNRLRDHINGIMQREKIDIWLSPAAVGPAPAGIESTGDPIMNLPWTHTGHPAVTIPAGKIGDLPLGLQCAAGMMQDEALLQWADAIAVALAG